MGRTHVVPSMICEETGVMLVAWRISREMRSSPFCCWIRPRTRLFVSCWLFAPTL